jgi:hypothetical protein
MNRTIDSSDSDYNLGPRHGGEGGRGDVVVRAMCQGRAGRGMEALH